MKMLIPLAIFVLMFTSCTSALYQEAQQKRDASIEDYQDARMRFDPEEMKSEIKTQLAGKWQFVGIEIETRLSTHKRRNQNPKTAKQHRLRMRVSKHLLRSNRLSAG